eukprot:TRINITY_DN16632_c0_g1_i1.p1 TRINITY_DN16632_c0_g1~~TRINITY_DN16632_c0_g1_i1.p1  ORF type:complete len:211 (+),score=55.09 TRINITY_DN16632_c0_g1_i1:1002-1634(+)
MDTYPTNQLKIVTNMHNHQKKHKRSRIGYNEKLSFDVLSLSPQSTSFVLTLIDFDAGERYGYECREGKHKQCYSFSVEEGMVDVEECVGFTVTVKCKGRQCVFNGKKQGSFCIAAMSPDRNQIYALSELIEVQTSRQKSKSKSYKPLIGSQGNDTQPEPPRVVPLNLPTISPPVPVNLPPSSPPVPGNLPTSSPPVLSLQEEDPQNLNAM